MLNTSQLILGELSLFGITHEERCQAAAQAGFTGVSLFWQTLCEGRDVGKTTGDFRREAENAGVDIVQLEFANLVPHQDMQHHRDLIYDMAESAAELGCTTLHAVALDQTLQQADIIENVVAISEVCTEFYLDCALEWVPYLSAVKSLPEAVSHLRDAAQPNLGLVFDTLHFQRGGAQWDVLSALRPDDVKTIQINDGPLGPPFEDYRIEAMERRLLPGDGDIDLVRILKTLAAIGCKQPLSLEIPNESLNELAPQDAAKKMAQSSRAVLELCNRD